MNKIIELVLDSIATHAKETASEIVEKYRLEKFTNDLEKAILEEYIKKYENEKYYMPLDVFLEINKFYEVIIDIIYRRDSEISFKKQCSIFANNFVEEYKEFSPFEKQINTVIFELASKINKAFLYSDLLNDNNKLYIRVNEQMKILQEGVLDVQRSVLDVQKSVSDAQENFSKMYDIMKKIQEHLSYTVVKEEKKKNDKEIYKELHEICIDETRTYYVKDIEYIKWISEHGDLKEGLIYIADNCSKAKDLERAKSYYEYIVQVYEEEYTLYNNWGVIELEQQKKDEAKKRFEKVLEYDENNINALYNLAVAHCKNNESNKASLEYITKAFTINPHDADVVSLYAALKLDEGLFNCEYVFDILNKALEVNPDNYYLNLNLGFVLLFQKRFAEGIDLLEKLNKDYPERIQCVSLLATLYAMKGVENPEKAIPLFEQVYNLTKDINYISNIEKLNDGEFFDSVIYNNKYYEIFSDEELIQYYASKGIK